MALSPKTCTDVCLILFPLFPSLTRNLMFVRCSNSSSDILAGAHLNTQTVTYATQKEIAIDQQHSCETPIGQRHQTILRLLSKQAHGGEFANLIVWPRTLHNVSCLVTCMSSVCFISDTFVLNCVRFLSAILLQLLKIHQLLAVRVLEL